MRWAGAILVAMALSGTAATQDSVPAATSEDDLAAGCATTEGEAKGGDLDAAFVLGRMYRDGVGCAVDGAKAREWLKFAADGGHVRAAVLLGLMLIQGEGGPKDRDEARELLLFATAARDEDAPYALGVLYAEGTARDGGGPGQDAAAAAYWFGVAARRGNVDGMYNLGLMFLRGLGVIKDSAEAYVWLEKAGRAGEPQAQILAAKLLADGKDIPADPKAALAWYYRAKANGLVDDELELRLIKQLSEADAAEAKRLASGPMPPASQQTP